MEGHKNTNRLSPCALGVAAGLTWGLGMLILGVVAMRYNYGKPFVDLMASIYMGYGATLKGSFVGAGWAFVDGFVSGLVFGWVYNFVLCICCGMCRKKSS